MKIKTQFFVTMVIFGVMLLIISWSLIVTNQEIDRLDKQEEIAVNIERGASDLSYLSNAYIIYRERQQRVRWEAKWSAVFKDLSTLTPGSPEQQTLVDNIKENQRRLKAVFSDVSAILEGGSRGQLDAEAVRAAVEVSWSRLAVQNQGTAFDALRLSQLLRNQKDQLRETNGRLILALLSLFTAYFIVNFLIVYRRALRAMLDLQAGTKVVGAGNLDFTIDVKRDDEIGQLSLAFNRMTASLKDVTASKTDLEREITERKKVEAALAAERKQLAVTLHSIGDGVITTDIEGTVVLVNRVAEELTGWSQAEAAGKPIDGVFNIINEKTRRPAKDPVRKVLKTGAIVGLANHTALIAKDGAERSIADSCAPIRDKEGNMLGVVLVFRDITESKKAEKALALLHQVTNISLSSLDAETIADGFVKIVAEGIGAGQIMVTLLDSSNRVLKSIAEYGLPPDLLENMPPAGVDSDYDSALVVQSGRPVIREDVSAGALSQDSREAIKEIGNIGSFAIFPLKAGEQTVGAVNFAWPQPRKFSPSEIEFFLAITAELAIGLQNARLYAAELEAQKRAKDELAVSTFLRKAGDVFAASIGLDEVLARLAEITLEATGLTRAFVNLIDMTERELIPKVATGGLKAPMGPAISFDKLSKTSVKAIIAKKTAILDYELPRTPEYDRKIAQANDSRLVLFVPLILKDAIIGHIALDEPGERRQFAKREIRLVEGCASQAAVAIDRARLYEAERRVSVTLQEALLTMPEEISGVDLGHIYRSATPEAAEVGGDFYDVFELDNERIGIIIGDVAGKGVNAAASTALVKNTIRAYAHQKYGPGIVMTLTNDALVERADPSVFVTVFFGILNIESDVLLYCVAGHPPPIVKRGAEVRLLENRSPAMGIIAGFRYGDQGTVLRKGDTLVLYTDGVTEARRGEEFFGETRLEELISSLKPTGAKQMTDMIFEHLMDFTGGNLRDDVVLLALSPAEPTKKTDAKL